MTEADDSNKNLSTEGKFPWADAYFRFVQFASDARKLVILHNDGMHQLITRKKIHDILADSKAVEQAREAERMHNIEVSVAAAAEQINSEHSLLRGHLLVGAWGAFESFIEDFTIAWMLGNTQILQTAAFKKVKLSVVDYHSAESDQDRMRLILQEAQRNSSADLRRGVNQFEALLELIGMAGPVEPTIREAVYVAQQVRNIIAHRAGVADRRLLESCPNQGFKLNENVHVSKVRFDLWLDSLVGYALIVAVRAMNSDQRRALKKALTANNLTSDELDVFLVEHFSEFAQDELPIDE